MAPYKDFYWPSADGLKLHARDYLGREDRPPVVCLPGLTRNARDFEGLAARLSPAWRVLAVDLRGRGASEYSSDPTSYAPLTYVEDVLALLAAIGAARAVFVGTSLGGIVTMLLAARAAGAVAAALINDVGPEIDPSGLGRIRGYVGKSSVWPTWMHAARHLGEVNGDIHPAWRIEDWLAMAKRLYRLNSSGRVVLDYDLKIAEPFRAPGGEAGPDMWAALAALADKPVAITRGERSDILGQPTAERMAAALPGAELVTVPNVGHAPMLDEPVAVAALDRLLARVAP